MSMTQQLFDAIPSRMVQDSNPYDLAVIKLFKSHKHANATIHDTAKRCVDMKKA